MIMLSQTEYFARFRLVTNKEHRQVLKQMAFNALYSADPGMKVLLTNEQAAMLPPLTSNVTTNE